MPQASPVAGLKEEVREFWNADPCGSRYLGDHATSRPTPERAINWNPTFTNLPALPNPQANECLRLESAWARIIWNG